MPAPNTLPLVTARPGLALRTFTWPRVAGTIDVPDWRGVPRLAISPIAFANPAGWKSANADDADRIRAENILVRTEAAQFRWNER